MNITIQDRDGDELYVRSIAGGPLLEIESDDDDTAYFVFKEEQREQVRKLRDFLTNVLGETPTDSGVWAQDISMNEAIMRLAALHGRTVKFRYAKGKGENIETRKLVPQEVREVKGNIIFVGQDPDRDDEYRAYRVDRMKGEVVIV